MQLENRQIPKGSNHLVLRCVIILFQLVMTVDNGLRSTGEDAVIEYLKQIFLLILFQCFITCVHVVIANRQASYD